jgi:hypothetical protein
MSNIIFGGRVSQLLMYKCNYFLGSVEEAWNVSAKVFKIIFPVQLTAKAIRKS